MAATAANPEVRKLTDAEAKREAMGRTFALVGSVVGAAGTVMLLSVNPAVQGAAGSAFKRLPASVQNHKLLIGLAVSGLALGLVGLYIVKKGSGK